MTRSKTSCDGEVSFVSIADARPLVDIAWTEIMMYWSKIVSFISILNLDFSIQFKCVDFLMNYSRVELESKCEEFYGSALIKIIPIINQQ